MFHIMTTTDWSTATDPDHMVIHYQAEQKNGKIGQ